MILVLPDLKDIKRKLRMIENGLEQGPTFSEVSTQEQPLTSSRLSTIETIPAHDFRAAACILYHGLCSFLFVQDSSLAANLKFKGKSFTKNVRKGIVM